MLIKTKQGIMAYKKNDSPINQFGFGQAINQATLGFGQSQITQPNAAMNPWGSSQQQGVSSVNGGMFGGINNITRPWGGGQRQGTSSMNGGMFGVSGSLPLNIRPSSNNTNNGVPTFGTGLAGQVAKAQWTKQKNKNLRMHAPINQKIFSDIKTVSNLYGKANPGTFTRSVESPMKQMVDPSQPINDPSLVPMVDPTDPNMQTGAENVMAATGIPQQPPYNVEQATTPPYDLSNS